MLNDLVRRAEREAAGQVDPFEDHLRRPLSEHVDAFERHLTHKGNTARYVAETTMKVRRIVEGCRWKLIRDLSASRTQQFLADLRTGGLSAQTANHHLRAIKEFSRWLVRDRRTGDDPLTHLSLLNVRSDRRHDRRALSDDEFARLVGAAEAGGSIESISGPDRAMMYTLAAWTGYRKGELGSLTPVSLQLNCDPPTATVEAAYSKRRRRDSQVLHPKVVQLLESWLATKPKLQPGDLLFPVSGAVPGGVERKTAKMMRLDLEAARRAWIVEAAAPDERKVREESDFLRYEDSTGRFADFHSNRHRFVTQLSRSGVSPKAAQTLARHSDIRLTMGTYAHIELDDQSAAISMLPPPPGTSPESNNSQSARATGTENQRASEVPTVVPRGAKQGAIRLASEPSQNATDCIERAVGTANSEKPSRARNSRGVGGNGTSRDQNAPQCIELPTRAEEVHPTGFEPVTFGSVDRCSIQLS